MATVRRLRVLPEVLPEAGDQRGAEQYEEQAADPEAGDGWQGWGGHQFSRSPLPWPSQHQPGPTL